jgi:hypothetical protein
VRIKALYSTAFQKWLDVGSGFGNCRLLLAIQQNRAETCPKPIQTFKTIPETLYSLQAETVVFNTQKYYPARKSACWQARQPCCQKSLLTFRYSFGRIAGELKLLEN